jgi:hypothetical protein
MDNLLAVRFGCPKGRLTPMLGAGAAAWVRVCSGWTGKNSYDYRLNLRNAQPARRSQPGLPQSWLL